MFKFCIITETKISFLNFYILQFTIVAQKCIHTNIVYCRWGEVIPLLFINGTSSVVILSQPTRRYNDSVIMIEELVKLGEFLIATQQRKLCLPLPPIKLSFHLLMTKLAAIIIMQ